MPMFSAFDNPVALVLEMVGRENELGQIRQVIHRQSHRPAVAFVVGDGGVGKTRLLREAAQEAQPGQGTLVDFYHIHYHAVDRFILALYRVLPHPAGLFDAYEDERRKAESAPYIERQQHRDQARRAFVTALAALSKQQRVVIVLDTLERLVYEQDGGGSSGANHLRAWKWLVDILPQLGEVTFFMAGREASRPLREELARLSGIDLVSIDLAPLDENQCWAYLQAAAVKCRQTGYTQTADVIENRLLPDQARLQPRIFEYTKGSPIFLSLMVDYLSVADQTSIETLLRGGLTPDEWEGELIKRLLTDIEDGDVIKFMGYLPKGVNLELLTEVMNTPATKIGEMFDAVKRFSFVKLLDDRLFLHDEMYRLLNEHEILDLPGTGKEAKQVQDGIQRYYDAQIAREAQHIKSLYQMIESEEGIDLSDSLAAASAYHERLLADSVYYRLRQNLVRGIERWYRYIHEATLSANHEMDIRLEFEMISFLSERGQAAWVEEKGLLPLLNFLLGVGVIRRVWAYEDYLGVIAMVSRVREQYRSLLEGNPILAAHLTVWEAYAQDASGSDQEAVAALRRLDQAIEELQPYEDEPLAPEDVWTWLAKTLLAFAYRVRGYTSRVRGLYQEAVDNYEHALRLFLETNVRVEIAYTQNDMGFALGEAGDYPEAIRRIEDALNRRYDLGIGVFIGLSHNTLGLVYCQQGQYDDAIRHSRPALRLFRALENQRGKGLALNALAEARRRKSSDLVIMERAAFLNQALDYANEARSIFEKLGELSRQVESLIEIGCAHRDWVRLCRDPEAGLFRGEAEQHLEAAQAALEEAARKAYPNILHRHVDALVNLAWLSFFNGDLDEVEVRAQQIEASVPRDYWINPETGYPYFSPSDPKAQRSVWPQLAKLCVLRGHVRLQRAQAGHVFPEERDQLLQGAGEMYALAMAYDLVFGSDHFGMQRARADIVQKLEKLHVQPDFLRAVATGVMTAEREFNLGNDTQKFLKENKLWVED